MTPGFIRRQTMIGGVINGVEEPWTLGYLIDVILTRDPWMHRLDICTGLDRTAHLTADHDGVIVADVVSEWAERHGKDFSLRLTGRLRHLDGRQWRPAHRTRAIGFCRVIAKRPGPVDFTELMSTEVPY